MKRTLSITLFLWGCTFSQGPQIPFPSFQSNGIEMLHFADMSEKVKEMDRLKLSGLKENLDASPHLFIDIQYDNHKLYHINM